MAVILRRLRSKLPLTIRTVGFGSEWSWGTYGNRRHSGCILQGAGVVMMCFQAPLRCPLALGKTGDGGWSVVSLEVIELVHQACAHGSG
jgi:hypothetical protein